MRFGMRPNASHATGQRRSGALAHRPDPHTPVTVLTRIQISPRCGPVPIIPGAPDEVVTKIAAGLPLIANARVERLSGQFDEPPHPPTTGLYLYYDLKVEATEGGWITRAVWEGHV